MKTAAKKPDYILFDRNTRAFIYNMQTNAVQRMLDFDYASQRETPSVGAIINPTGSDGLVKFFFGPREVLLPVYKSLKTAAEKCPDVDVMINFASFRSAAEATLEAFALPQIKTVAIIAEGIPERKVKELIAKAKELDKVMIGPATIGGIAAGAFKIGNTGGTLENILDSKLHRPGSVGCVSNSGGLSNETYNIISRNTDGLYEGIAIGGDSYPGTTLVEHLLRFEKNPAIKMLVSLGEVGGNDEYEIVEALREKRITKPLVIWVTGTCSKAFKTEMQFGHAGAKAHGETETADAKNKALKDAGAFVPDSFDDYDSLINKVYTDLVKEGVITPAPEPQIPNVPVDYKTALQSNMIRKPTNFICTISDDRGEECLYGSKTISQVVQEGLGIGGTISLLWFKRLMPQYASDFIEMCLVITADHGPAVSGAHNCIVASRAGKDLISSLVSGLLTIGPRFGGAIDGAAQMFSEAYDAGISPAQFISGMKKKGINIQGIGHLIKSTHNPDMRVSLLKEFALNNFKETPILNYALEVEKITTTKRDNLILNVDGCIGICFADLLRNEMSKEEADEYISMGALNALFVMGRSIGLIGHHLDQKRLKQGLYRHPWDDISFLSE
ncbi:MAG: citrate/2-methylcitrate synthase [Bacillota bacterium]|nr:citrate/2-methylcitrate synthase [Bacillota bacterium]